MATWDSADLLARCKALAHRPATDASMPDASWYNLLTEGQAHWTNVLSAHCPWLMMGPPVTLVSTDGGLTFPFPGCVFPLAVELYDTTTPARLLRPGSYWDSSCDYVWEGDHIRFPQGQSNPLATSPVARYINPPDAVNASTQPTFMPPHARLLMVYWAVGEWARRGGMRDPKPYDDLMQKMWYDPANGTGLLVTLKLQNPFYGGTALITGDQGLLGDVSTGQGYIKVNP